MNRLIPFDRPRAVQCHFIVVFDPILGTVYGVQGPFAPHNQRALRRHLRRLWKRIGKPESKCYLVPTTMDGAELPEQTLNLFDQMIADSPKWPAPELLLCQQE